MDWQPAFDDRQGSGWTFHISGLQPEATVRIYVLTSEACNIAQPLPSRYNEISPARSGLL
jgi:hypothetical protein